MFPIASGIISGSTTGSYTFSNIPQTYTHLQLRVFARTLTATTSEPVYLYNFNNNGGSTGSASHWLVGDGGAALSQSATNQYSSYLGPAPANNATANVFGVSITDILDYTSTNKNKTLKSIAGFDANGSGSVLLISNLPLTLPGTNAITTLTVSLAGGNYFVAGSRFDLYGLQTSSVTGA